MSETNEADRSGQADPVVRIIARGLFERDFKAATPDATSDQIKAAWSAQRRDFMRAAKQFRARLAKRGVTMQAGLEANDQDSDAVRDDD